MYQVQGNLYTGTVVRAGATPTRERAIWIHGDDVAAFERVAPIVAAPARTAVPA